MKRKSLHVTVYERMRYHILSGEWPAGTQLPPERRLSELWGVSRNTIVNAYADLQAEDLILCKVGSGRYVKPLPPHAVQVDWKHEVSHSHSRFTTSPITKLYQLSTDRTLINFAFGEGGRHILAESDFSTGMDVAHVLDMCSADYLVPVLGDEGLRNWIVDWVSPDFLTTVDQVMVTSGSLEAIHLAASILAQSGDSVAVEMPTFFAAVQVFESMGLHIIPIPMDDEGMRVDVLEGILHRARPRFIYTNPTFHNPTGTVLPMHRREKLVQLAERFGVPIIEDDAYRHLHFDEVPPAPLKALDEHGNVIYVQTFSKVLFPGLRLGWVTANGTFMESLIRRKELSFTTNTFAEQTLLSYLQRGTFPNHLQRARTMYRRQARVMEEQLDTLKGLGIHYTPAKGGFYSWVGLPDGIHSVDFFRLAVEHGVMFATGDMFLTREVHQPYIRLSYSHEDVDRICEGMGVLTSILHSM